MKVVIAVKARAVETINMSDNNLISFADAKEQLDDLMKSLMESDRKELFSYVLQKWMPTSTKDDAGLINNYLINQNDKSNSKDDDDDDDDYNDNDDILDDPMYVLNSIIKKIRYKVPVSGILPADILRLPKRRENSMNSKGENYVDAFLYNDPKLDDFKKRGIEATHYCQDCDSINIKPVASFIHSMSKDDLYDIFDTHLPLLPGKKILNVGSRLGAVLYGAYVFTDAAEIIGIEMNDELCELQNEIIEKFRMEKRVKVLHKRIEDCPDIVEAADVVILNNEFDFFLPIYEQVMVWNFLQQHIKTGAFIITKPSINDSLNNIFKDVNMNIDNWVEVLSTNEANGITCYKVL